MDIPLLPTKLYTPLPLRGLVNRTRLIDRLRAALDYRLILVSAPAGFGKTTLLSAWLIQSAHTATWLSLDEGDNDPARFLSYLVHALQKVSGEIGQSVLAMLQALQVLSTQVQLMQLVSDIDRLHKPFFLILDDYHVIHEPAVHQAVSFVLEQLPWQMHLVVSTRADPPLPLARLRAGGQMLEIRTAELSFTSQDTRVPESSDGAFDCA